MPNDPPTHADFDRAVVAAKTGQPTHPTPAPTQGAGTAESLAALRDALKGKGIT